MERPKAKNMKKGRRFMALLLSFVLVLSLADFSMITIQAAPEEGTEAETEQTIAEDQKAETTPGEETQEETQIEQTKEETATEEKTDVKSETEHETVVKPEEQTVAEPKEKVSKKAAAKAVRAREETVVSWKWSGGESLGGITWDNSYKQWWYRVDARSDDNSTIVTRTKIQQQLKDVKIAATLSSGSETLLDLIWDLEQIPESGTYEGGYILNASLPTGYKLSGNAPDITVELRINGTRASARFPGRRTQLSASELTAAVTGSDHTVAAVEPENVTVNLFDYAVNQNVSAGGTQSDLLSKSQPGNAARQNSWNFGINHDRMLLFGDSMANAGLWNLGAGAGRPWAKRNTNMKHIVENSLGDDGYPKVNLKEAQKSVETLRDDDIWGLNMAEEDDGTRADARNLSSKILSAAGGTKTAGDTWDTTGINPSLAYLFDPANTEAGQQKSAYKNVKGLFQLNNEGYYYYYARENFAELDTSKKTADSDGSFKLYDGPAIWRTDGGYSHTAGTLGTSEEDGNFNGDMSLGNFYPFNKGSQVFDSLDENGHLTSSTRTLLSAGTTNSGENQFNAAKSPDAKKNQATGEEFYINHHMGMSVDMTFRQPLGGMVNTGSKGKKPMTFQFSGDDDVWVFIDDVLVLDIGGIHSELYGTIDFSTGEVAVGQSWRTGGKFPDQLNGEYPGVTDKTTLRDCFRAAGKEDTVAWNRNGTFASNTTHTVKMFYLERGNYDSSLALRFNLQPLLPQEVKKVDQNGNPLGNVEFTMHPATLTNENDPDAIRCANVIGSNNEARYIKQSGNDNLATLKTGVDGRAQFIQDSGTGTLYNFADNYQSDQEGRFYILEETNAPPGYRTLPIPIILEFNPNTTMLSVANRWTTGAYASFNSYVVGNNSLNYAQFDPATADLKATDQQVDRKQQSGGLVLALPMLYQTSSSKWEAMYGDNTQGFHTETPANRTAEEWRKAALRASLHQCADERSPSWYLEWSEKEHRLKGTLSDLPGRADRYLLNNPDSGDMRMVYAIITEEGLNKLGVTGNTSEEKYENLRKHILNKNPGNIDTAIKETMAELRLSGEIGEREFSFLNVDEFNRDFRSLIYIPNEQRELRVQKVDQNGTSLNGAVFGLYDSNTNQKVSEGTTADVNGQKGVLIFTPKPEMEEDNIKVKAGYGKIEWANRANTSYYLKEIKAPAGHKINDTKIPIVVGIYSIYADAGIKDDGITVMAGVGKLAQTMTKYANDETVNITLRDITAIGQTQKSGAFNLDGWKDMELDGTKVVRKMNLHYGKNAVVDYGLHDEDGGKNLAPFFVTDTGFVRARVQQNYEALTSDIYENNVNNNANKDNLGDTHITSLFSLLNIVVVTDKTDVDTDTGKLTIRKTVTGPKLTQADYTRNFDFTVNFTGTGDKEFYFYGTDKSGHVKSGDTIPLHHDESITILGLPVGTGYSVTEAPEKGFTALPDSTIKGNIAIKDAEEIAHFRNTKEKTVIPDPKNPELTIEKDQALNGGKRTKELLKAEAGDTVTYYITVKSTGEETARDVTVTDAVPSGLKLVKGSISDKGTEKNGVITWKLGDLGSGKKKTVSFRVTVPQVEKYTKWTNVAATRYSNNPEGPDKDIPSNKVEVEEPVPTPDPSPELIIEKNQSLNNRKPTKELLKAEAGDTVTYYLTVKNRTETTAKDVTVTDAVPSGLKLVKDSISDKGTEKNGIITWHLGNLGAGKSKTVSFRVTVPQVEKYTKWTNVAAARYSNNPEGPDKDIPSEKVAVESDPPGVAVQTDDPGNHGLWLALALLALLVMITVGNKAAQYRKK